MPVQPEPTPAGPEFRVNATAAGDQGGPSVAAFADGGFVATWTGWAADGTYDVFAQRFAADGRAVGGEFRVNALTAGDQLAGDVAALADGGFVVSWAGAGADGTSDAFARRFAADGAAAGAEFRVDAAATGDQGAPAVAALAGGGFVASWSGQGADGTLDVFARRFAADGSAAGAEFRPGPGPGAAGAQYQPSVAALADGGFAVSWKDDLGIFAQRFAADGAAAGAEVRVNAITPGIASRPDVAALADGGFVVSWDSNTGNRRADVFAQRFTEDGSAAGGEFRVRESSLGMNWQPAVTGLADGGFVVSWVNSELVGSAGLVDRDVVARRYAADGSAAGGDFRVTATSNGKPGAPSAAALPGGGFVVAWTGADAAGDRDVLARAFSVPGGDGGGPPDAPVVRGTAGDDVLARAPGAGVVYDGLGGRDALDMGHLGFRGVAVAARADGDATLARGADACVLRGVEEVRFADGRLVFDPSDPAAKVVRLYEAALDRPPDQAGLNSWIDALERGGHLSDLARAFLASAESQARFGGASVSDGAFVDRLYQNVLGRAGDAGGLKFWVDSLGHGASRAEVLAAFSESAENKAGTATLVAGGIWDRSEAAMEVARLYDSMLGRRPDAEGLTFWKDALESGHATLAQVADAFAAGAEFRAGHGALGDRGFVEALYGNALDRAADQEGLDFWTGRLEAGVPRSAVVLAFSESIEHAALTAPSIGGEHPSQFGVLFA